MSGIITETVAFKGSLGYSLEAKIDRPSGSFWGAGVFAPCFTCTKESLAASRICKALAEEGLAMLRLDFTGQGASQGTFSDTNFSTHVEDLLRAMDFLKSHRLLPSLLIGHSLGGTAALVAAARASHIKALITLNSPATPLHVARHFKHKEEELLNKGEIEISIAGKLYLIQKHFLEDLKTYHMNQLLKDLKAALLIMHAPEDPLVRVQNASELFKKASHPKSFISLEKCDHLITNKSDALYIARLIIAWADRYMVKFKEVP